MMNLYELQLEELENVNGGLVPVEMPEGFKPSGPNQWGDVIDWVIRGVELWKLRP